MAITLEIAVDSTADAVAAAAGGADRLELAAHLDRHGLTPAPDLIRDIKAAVAIPVLAIIRPAPNPVIHREADAAAALDEAERAFDAGADGLVFGFLRPDRSIDRDLAIALRILAGPRDAVFHRAFDLTPDPFDAIDQLAELGITRILTAGQSPAEAARAMNLDFPDVAADHAPAESDPDLARFERIRRYRRHAGDRIQILPGGGIRAVNITTLVHSTGADQVHSSARTPSRAGFDPVELRELRAALDGLAR